MSNPALPQPSQVVGPGVTPAKPFLDGLFGGFWPEQSVPATPRLVVGALVAGLVAALVLPFRAPGIGTFLVLVVVAAVRRPFEWLVPVGIVVALFAAFVVAQLAVMFGGHAYLQRTTGLTYAEYVHQGFGQLTVATLLTLAVVGVAARKASRATASDRLLLRAVLGLLCLLTLVVVASADSPPR